MIRVYLDNCCYNRPYDDQNSVLISLETQAKLYIQAKIEEGKIELAWSFINDFENEMNPFEENRMEIQKWKTKAGVLIVKSEPLILKAVALMNHGIRLKDSLHITCAIISSAKYFLTTDRKLINKSNIVSEINIINPIEFLRQEASL